MYYSVKSGDTLSKIARKFSVPVELILAHNSSITNPSRIFTGQQLFIPDISDIPQPEFNFDTVDTNKLVTRARTAINKGIRYKLGSGGMNPDAPLPTTDNKCDCSGFVCWVIQLSRKTTLPFYRKFGGWIYTDSIVADITTPAGIFEQLTIPEVGCIVAYGAGNQIGHTGIVSAVKNGKMEKVIHCSSGNNRKYQDAIQETTPEVFDRADSVWGKFTG